MEYKPRLEEASVADGQPGFAAPRRRFSIIGVAMRILVAVGIVAAGLVFAQRMIADQPEPVRRSAFERSFTVAVEDAASGAFSTTVRSFGEVQAATSLDVRSGVSGAIVSVSPNLRPGGIVVAGEVLAEIDSFDYELALSNAENDLADAMLALREAEAQQANLKLNVDFLSDQYDVAVADLDRARALAESGSITNQEIGARELVVSQREQSLRQAESTLDLQDATIERRQAEIERARRAVGQAGRTLAGTVVYALFDGVVVSANAVRGATVTNNETIATIYDTDTLEVRFSLSERDYGLLSRGQLIGTPVRANWDIDPEPVVLNGAITRIGAEIDSTLGGVELFAELKDAAGTLVRPGTFVAIELQGVTYENSLRLPETAIYDNNHFYIVEEGRMVSVDAAINARDGDFVIVRADVPEGARIITTRLAQAGDGVKVTVEGEEQSIAGRPGEGGEAGSDGPAEGGRGGPPGGGRGGPPGGG